VTLETQQLLALALIAVYLLDSMHWLRLGETVVITRRGALRRLSLGSAFELGGRRPFLPNPFTPFWPELRAGWTMRPGGLDARQASQEMAARAASLAITGTCSGVSAAAIVVGAPLAMLAHHDDAFLGCALVSVLATLTGSAFLYRRREALGLSMLQWVSMTLIALICLPCSANLARAAGRARSWSLPPLTLSQLTLTGADPAHTRGQLREALRAAQRYVEEDSAEARGLAEQLQLLEKTA
jgi:hypothetical protein